MEKYDAQSILDQVNEETSLRAAPIVRQMAKQDGVDLSEIVGTGKGGTITKVDYEKHTGRVQSVPREEPRSPMNHLTDNETQVAGMTFRRARSGLDFSTKTALDIPQRCLNKELEYRWVNDQNGRVEKLREAGYEIVDPKTLAKDEEISVRRRVGSKKDGSDLHAVLMATPKKWYQDRHVQVEQNRKDKEDGMFRTPQDDSGKPLGNDFYNKGSRIR